MTKIPNMFRKIEVDFWSLNLVTILNIYQVFVHLGIIILVVFLVLASRDAVKLIKEVNLVIIMSIVAKQRQSFNEENILFVI